MTPFASVLVANRGEIALRIMRSARAMGLRCIAIHTEADADAPHVGFADRAICIGQGPAEDSYLSIPAVIRATRDSGAEAIHPGYGFLSESAEFAAACAEAGLVFIGPSAQAIALMGNKAAAKREMMAASVPCVPGYEGADQSAATLATEAGKIGYPVMIKAAAGGGGRGMRLVETPDGFADALNLARSEARAAFGSDEVILEKAIASPRHVEIQVLADRAGTVLHLGERDCSVQRRHQKVVEESPCPVMTPDLRARMGASAVQAAQAIGYEGAGTVEFLLDASGAFYFLEMNTRLQVEHPVTEMVTGLDLVALQLRVASGALLELTQEDVRLTGHAIEVRLYAEDPASDFLPQSGRVTLWEPPHGEGVRVDDGVSTGQTVPPYYDPMQAKIIAHGTTRTEAIARLTEALRATTLMGIRHNRDFLIRILSHPEFAAGRATTAFVADNLPDLLPPAPTSADHAMAAALLYHHQQRQAAHLSGGQPAELLGWGSPGALFARMRLDQDGTQFDVQFRETRDGLDVTIGDTTHRVTDLGRTLRVDGLRCDLRRWIAEGDTIHVSTATRVARVSRVSVFDRGEGAAADGRVTAPMHGSLVQIAVAEGDHVEAGARLAVLEAMKLQHEIVAPVTGRVASVPVPTGQQVRSGQVLIEIDEQG